MNIYELPDYTVVEEVLHEELTAVAERFWCALCANYIRNKGSTSLPYWSEQFGDPMAFNALLFILRDWIKTVVVPERNWGEVSVNEEKLIEVYGAEALKQLRIDDKLGKYLPKFNVSDTDDKVKIHGKIKRTGLVRSGFAAASATQYYFDTGMLKKYRDGIARNTTKGMTKMRLQCPHYYDEVAYDIVAEQIVDLLAEQPELFTQEGNISDSRGRSIKTSLKRVGNPIGYKDFRALLTIPEM